MKKEFIILAGVSVAAFILGILVSPRKTPATEYITLTETKTDWQYWGKVETVTKWKNRTVEREVVSPDGTITKEKEVSSEGDSSQSNQNSGIYTIVSLDKNQVVTPSLSRYRLGLSVDALTVKVPPTFPVTQLQSYRISAEARLGNLPIWLGVGFQPKLNNISMSIALEL